MTTRRPRGPRPNNNYNNYNSNHYPHPSDYESDNNQNFLSDTQKQQQSPPPPPSMPPAPLRSNEDLNISVLRRHNPCITSVLSLAPYAVVYVFSPTMRQWEKSGIEGTMFVCQLSQGSLGEERYSVFVLNRRGLNNFDILLTDGENVELTEEYVILKVDNNHSNNNSVELDAAGGETGRGSANTNNPIYNGNNTYNNPTTTIKEMNTTTTTTNNNGYTDDDIRFYGLWIFSEPPPNSTAETRTLNAQIIKECAVHAAQSLKLARERLEAVHQSGLHLAAAATSTAAAPTDEVQQSGIGVPMGRQISLQDLFGQQRAQDDGWSVKVHSLGPGQMQSPQHTPLAEQEPRRDVLGDLFRRAGLVYQGGGGQGLS